MRFLAKPWDFSRQELEKLLAGFGYELRAGGRGSLKQYQLEEGREPDRSFKGSSSVRVGKELHRQAALMARQRGLSLNAFVIDALKKASQRQLAG